LKEVRVKAITVEERAARKIIAGHPWVYANEVTVRPDDLADVDLVLVRSPEGRVLATGYYHKHSLIQVRVLTRRDEPADADLVRRRLAAALARREALYPDLRSYRLVYGECDGLPGLVVDRYEDVLVVELNTQGIFLFQDAIVDGLVALLAPRGIVLHNASSALAYEQLAPHTELLHGSLEGPVVIDEYGVKFLVDPLQGQKTGFFLDQRENRRRLREHCRDRAVWDVFAYSGAWGLHALAAGASRVTFVDSSEPACELIYENLRLNGWTDRAEVVQASAFDHLRELPRNAAEVMILDPPAFAKTKKDVPAALKAYVDINREGLRAVAEGGVLASSSCSFHVGAELFAEVMARAVFQSRQRVELLHVGGQAPDHPVHLEFPESRYLDTLFVRKLPYHP
jgi:23S rRNA (cytosine1962-C5)-methyltransferase